MWIFSHFLATVNNAVMNVHVQVVVWTYIFGSFRYIPRNGSCNNYVEPFEELPNCLPKGQHHFRISPALYEDSNFSISLLTLVIVCMLYFSHLSQCEVVAHFGFDLYFPNG